ncbi:MAG: hypothetical protein NVSMB65_16750 [Chloroflexota bacterium]
MIEYMRRQTRRGAACVTAVTNASGRGHRAAPEGAMVSVQEGLAGPANRRVKATRLVLRSVFRLLFKVRVSGLANVPGTPLIVCANHLGWADPFLIVLLLPVEPRLYVLGEQVGVLRNSFRTWVIGGLQVMVPLQRDHPRAAVRAMEDVLQRGGSLILFPEGHLGAAEGALQTLQPGAAHLSLRSGVPLLPVGLTGTRELWLRRTLTVRVGPPLYPADCAAGTMHSRVAEMTGALDGALRGLLPGDGQRARVKLLRRWLTELL